MGVRGCASGRTRPKDLGTLDGSRGGLILQRRVKAAPARAVKDGLDHDLLIRSYGQTSRTVQQWPSAGRSSRPVFLHRQLAMAMAAVEEVVPSSVELRWRPR